MDANWQGDHLMAAKMKLNKKTIKEMQLYIFQMKRAGIPFEKIILFGSYAKGNAHHWSDIDICVVSDSFGKNRHEERLKLMRIKDEETIDIEPHPYNKKDLINKWDSLAAEINRNGILVE